jgi:hypothetical protein
MDEQRLERVLGIVAPARRAAIKKLVGIGFAVPTVASFAVKDLAFGLAISDATVTTGDRDFTSTTTPSDSGLTTTTT